MTFRLGDVATLPLRIRAEDRVCRRKLRHDSLEAASQQMESLYASGRAKPGSLKVYECHFCRGYHVGHP